jgi:hypothetical protein
VCLLLYQHKCDRGLSAVMMMSRIVPFCPSVEETRVWWPFGCCHFLPGTVCFVPAVQSLSLSPFLLSLFCA